MKPVTVTDLQTYPIKGAQGVPVDFIEITELGIAGDREFTIWEEGHLVDQKADQWVAAISADLDRSAGTLVLGHATHGSFMHEIQESGVVRPATWVIDEFETIDQGDEVAGWLSGVLGRSVRLVSTGEPWQINFPVPQMALLHEQPKQRFTAASPVSVANAASLDALNGHLDHPIGMDRFRMNVTVEGLDAYEEDRLDQLSNGDVSLRSVSPAERCVIVTTDQVTGERPRNNVLRTLSKHRMKPKQDRYGSGMKFGNYLTVEKPGTLAIGDTLMATFVSTDTE